MRTSKEYVMFITVCLFHKEKMNESLWDYFFGNNPVAHEDCDIQVWGAVCSKRQFCALFVYPL